MSARATRFLALGASITAVLWMTLAAGGQEPPRSSRASGGAEPPTRIVPPTRHAIYTTGDDAPDVGEIVQDADRLARAPTFSYDLADPSSIDRAIEQAYWAGRLAERAARRQVSAEDRTRRQARAQTAHGRALQLGLEKLAAGQYDHAVVAFKMAGDLDNGDPACRIHMAQALGQGLYGDAGRDLRRALQLQPKLAYLDLNLPSYLPTAQAFDEQVDALAAAATNKPLGPEADFLLGYLEFQRGRFDMAQQAFRRVSRSLPKDPLTLTYLDLTRTSASK